MNVIETKWRHILSLNRQDLSFESRPRLEELISKQEFRYVTRVVLKFRATEERGFADLGLSTCDRLHGKPER